MLIHDNSLNVFVNLIEKVEDSSLIAHIYEEIIISFLLYCLSVDKIQITVDNNVHLFNK